MIVIDKLCYSSKLRYINIEEKAAFLFATLLVCIFGRSVAGACLVLAVNAYLTVRKGGIAYKRFWKWMSLPITFLLLGTVPVLINISRIPLDAFALPLGSMYITARWADILFALRLFLSALASVSCLYCFALSTPVTDFLMLLKRLRLPSLLVELMLLIYRFIFLLLETASAIRTAQDARLGNRDYKTAVRSFGFLGSALLLRALKRSGALYDAMEARGYDGNISVLTETYPAKRKEIRWIVCFELLLTGITITERLLF